jgi:hypothetical protein
MQNFPFEFLEFFHSHSEVESTLIIAAGQPKLVCEHHSLGCPKDCRCPKTNLSEESPATNSLDLSWISCDAKKAAQHFLSMLPYGILEYPDVPTFIPDVSILPLENLPFLPQRFFDPPLKVPITFA